MPLRLRARDQEVMAATDPSRAASAIPPSGDAFPARSLVLAPKRGSMKSSV
jgi:hypothetical protein